MPQRNILIVAIDGLRASALGAYGNTSFATPELDQFAAESLLLDSCFAPAPQLAAIYRALWHSQHPLRPAVSERGPSLPRLLSSRGYATTLVTDEPELRALDAAGDFDQCVQIAPAGEPHILIERAEENAQTAMARLFAAACEVGAASSNSPRLVWIHSRGMYGPWDAPIELQEALLEEGDPPPVETVAPPDVIVAKGDDPDAAFRYGCAYAAQVIVLDACWNALMEAFRRGGADEWLVVLVGVRGYPLGEHRRIGGVDERLYAEQLHVPAMIRFPSGVGRLARSGALTSHLDLMPTLAQWIDPEQAAAGAPLDGMSVVPLATAARSAWRDVLLTASAAGARAIRTAGWCLRQEAAMAEEVSDQGSAQVESELFVRPDDRWEANDVAKLCPEVVEALSLAIEDFSRRIAHGEPVPNDVLPKGATVCGS